MPASAREGMGPWFNSNPKGLIAKWDMIFLVSSVLAVSMDPLFLYIPVIDQHNKCLFLDSKLKKVAICLRSVMDAIYVANIFWEYLSLKKDGAASKLKRGPEDSDALQTGNRVSRYLVIDILAILPIPQVLISIAFSIKKGSKLLGLRRFLDAIILLQYVPRVLRIYLSWRKHQEIDCKPFLIKLKAGFNFLLYILASYVLGAFWYLFSVERQTTCWHRAHASENIITSSFRCLNDSEIFNPNGSTTSTITVLKKYCPVKTKDAGVFDFGIFFEAIQSGIVTSRNIPQRILYSFWWGHRNLSSLGQNLETSANAWENCFAILISILGLLLLLYFIENLKNYMQSITKSSKKRKIKDLSLWLYKNELYDEEHRKEIISKVQRHMSEEDKHNNLPEIFSSLPREVKYSIYSPLLTKVQNVEGITEKQLLLMIEYLQPVSYDANIHILRKGEIIDTMLFITEGTMLTYSGEGSAQCIENKLFLGKELLEWMSNDSTEHRVSNLPISEVNVKTITKVEAFALMFTDLKAVDTKLKQAASNAANELRTFSKFRGAASDAEASA